MSVTSANFGTKALTKVWRLDPTPRVADAISPQRAKAAAAVASARALDDRLEPGERRRAAAHAAGLGTAERLLRASGPWRDTLGIVLGKAGVTKAMDTAAETGNGINVLDAMARSPRTFGVVGAYVALGVGTTAALYSALGAAVGCGLDCVMARRESRQTRALDGFMLGTQLGLLVGAWKVCTAYIYLALARMAVLGGVAALAGGAYLVGALPALVRGIPARPAQPAEAAGPRPAGPTPAPTPTPGRTAVPVPGTPAAPAAGRAGRPTVRFA